MDDRKPLPSITKCFIATSLGGLCGKSTWSPVWAGTPPRPGPLYLRIRDRHKIGIPCAPRQHRKDLTCRLGADHGPKGKHASVPTPLPLPWPRFSSGARALTTSSRMASPNAPSESQPRPVITRPPRGPLPPASVVADMMTISSPEGSSVAMPRYQN